MTEKDFFNSYCNFADFVASAQSKDDELYNQTLTKLSTVLNGQLARMDMAVSGIAGEAGEIADLWKKIKFHGKEFDAENKDKMIKELGDMFWYLAQASMALNVSMEEIINQNIEKLKARHPNGFSQEYMKIAK